MNIVIENKFSKRKLFNGSAKTGQIMFCPTLFIAIYSLICIRTFFKASSTATLYWESSNFDLSSLDTLLRKSFLISRVQLWHELPDISCNRNKTLFTRLVKFAYYFVFFREARARLYYANLKFIKSRIHCYIGNYC